MEPLPFVILVAQHPFFTKKADIIIVALGVPQFLTGNMIKKGSVIIDVGINRVDGFKGISPCR